VTREALRLAWIKDDLDDGRMKTMASLDRCHAVIYKIQQFALDSPNRKTKAFSQQPLTWTPSQSPVFLSATNQQKANGHGDN
jgi:hypothetical protein